MNPPDWGYISFGITVIGVGIALEVSNVGAEFYVGPTLVFLGLSLMAFSLRPSIASWRGRQSQVLSVLPVCGPVRKRFGDLDSAERSELQRTPVVAAFWRITNEGAVPLTIAATATATAVDAEGVSSVRTPGVSWSASPGESYSRGEISSSSTLGVGESRLLLVAISPLGTAWFAPDPNKLRSPSDYFVGEANPFENMHESLMAGHVQLMEHCLVNLQLRSADAEFSGAFRLAINPPRFTRAS